MKTDTMTTGKSRSFIDGISLNNPGQSAVKKVFGINTANMGEDGASTLDNVAGTAVETSKGVLAFAGLDHITGGHVRKGVGKFAGKGRNLRRSLFGSEEPINKGTNEQDNWGSDKSDPKSRHNKTPSINSNIGNYTTDTQITQTRTALDLADRSDVGKKAIQSSLHEAAKEYPKGSPERTKIAQMQQNLRKIGVW